MAIRSFVALELSDEVRERLTELLKRLRQTNAAVKMGLNRRTYI